MSALAVVHDHDSFVRTLGGTSRSALSPGQVDEMRRVCQQHDYDLKFRSVLEVLEDSAVVNARHESETRWDTALAGVLTAQWTQLGVTEWRRSRTLAARLRALPVWLSRKLGRQRSVLDVAGRLGRAPQEAASKGILALRLLIADGVLRRLLWAYASDGEARRQVGIADVLADLLRLGIIRWYRRYPRAGEQAFDVDVQYEPVERRLLFVSVRRRQTAPESRTGGGAVLDDAGKLEQIVWDHSAVGRTVLWAPPSGQRLHVGVGADGIYEFAAIGALARRDPKGRWRALVVRVVTTG